ncbi:MAG: type II toxin-antitoxin system prevent-host-death family antitoxin [Nitrospinae bacterium]|nr:type II toxin-antitoxin system prevent-host-death family antitoxin [Nitrospinota bacterium]
MQQVNVTEFRKHLPDYMKQVGLGEEFQLLNYGKVIARLVPDQDKASAAQERLLKQRGKVIVGDVMSSISQNWSAGESNL